MKQSGDFGNSLPASNSSQIHVHKPGVGIIPDSPTAKIQRRVAQTGCRHSRDTNINCFPAHVLAMFGNSHSRAPEIFVAPRCAITADDVDFGFGSSQARSQIIQQVEKPRIKSGHIARSMISQKMIQPAHGVWNIGVAPTVHDVDSLMGVQMEKNQSAFCGTGIRRCRNSYRQQKCRCENNRGTKKQSGGSPSDHVGRIPRGSISFDEDAIASAGR